MIDTDKYEEKLEHRMNKEFCNYISSGDMQKELAIQYAHEFYVNALDLLAVVKRLQEENKVLAKYRDIVSKYDNALLVGGDEDPRWSKLYVAGGDEDPRWELRKND